MPKRKEQIDVKTIAESIR